MDACCIGWDDTMKKWSSETGALKGGQINKKLIFFDDEGG
jgi:hypothetical protein